MKDERKKRMVGTNMKPRGIQAENAEIVPEQPTAEGQPKSILEPVLSRNQAVETPYSLEAEKVQNLESPENPIVADAEAENGQIQPFVESELDTEKRLDIEDDLEKAMAQVMEPQTNNVTIYKSLSDGRYVEMDGNVDLGQARMVDPRIFIDRRPPEVEATFELGQQQNGDCKFAVTVQEGYVNAVREWAEADGITPEEWLSNIITSNIETYAMPAKGR